MARPFAPYANTNRQNQDIYENAVNRHFKAAHVPTVSPSYQERQETMAFKKNSLPNNSYDELLVLRRLRL